MLKFTSYILQKGANLLNRIANKIYHPLSVSPSVQRLRVIPWFKDNGDKTHRLNYDLNENSLVFDLGGYEGQWANDIFGKFVCNIYVFEPYIKFALNIKERFEKNSKIKVYQFGLASETKKTNFFISADGSSIFEKSENQTEVQFIRALDFMNENNITKIDLMKMNIEGGEYDLLEHLIETGFISKTDNIQVQFHDFIPDAENRMKNIQKDLSKTHYLTYQYEFVWENWKLKDI